MSGGVSGEELPVRLDVGKALKRTLMVLVADAASVSIAGLVLVLLPAIGARLAAAGSDYATLVTIARFVAAMLFTALVSWGIVSRLNGRALPPAVFLREGLARAQPGLQVALLVGAAVVAGLTLHLFARSGTTAGWLLNSLLLTAGLLGACVLMPLVPVAVVERLGPAAAFRRAAALTEGSRNRILALALVALLTLAPSAALVAGFAGPASPWLAAIVEFAAWGLAAVVPAVVYAGLRGEAV